MIIVSDIVSLKDRGKYQGFLGSAIAIGGGIGPLIGGVFSQTATWRWYDFSEKLV
jgi:MFS family permease